MNEYLERTNAERDRALGECPPNSEPYPEVSPESAPRVRNIPPFPPEAKPRPFWLFFCGLKWSVIPGIVMLFSDRNGNGTLQVAFLVLMLALSIAALGLVWGVFQHVLKTIVQIVRRA